MKTTITMIIPLITNQRILRLKMFRLKTQELRGQSWRLTLKCKKYFSTLSILWFWLFISVLSGWTRTVLDINVIAGKIHLLIYLSFGRNYFSTIWEVILYAIYRTNFSFGLFPFAIAIRFLDDPVVRKFLSKVFFGSIPAYKEDDWQQKR